MPATPPHWSRSADLAGPWTSVTPTSPFKRAKPLAPRATLSLLTVRGQWKQHLVTGPKQVGRHWKRLGAYRSRNTGRHGLRRMSHPAQNLDPQCRHHCAALWGDALLGRVFHRRLAGRIRGGLILYGPGPPGRGGGQSGSPDAITVAEFYGRDCASPRGVVRKAAAAFFT